MLFALENFEAVSMGDIKRRSRRRHRCSRSSVGKEEGGRKRQMLVIVRNDQQDTEKGGVRYKCQWKNNSKQRGKEKD